MRRLFRAIGAGLADHWYRKLTLLFVTLMVWQTISIFEGFWWEETYTIARGTLLTSAIIGIIIPYRFHILKLVLQIAAALIITVRFTPMEWLIAKPENFGDWLWWAQAHAVQLHPFIWISGALLLIQLLFGLWVTTRTRMFAFLGVTIMTLTVADSFTPIWLWEEVGIVVFVGLLWLVAGHLHRLQKEHPSSWSELIEYPLQLILPIALVLAVLMTVGLNMPSLSPILQDPYTIWKESKGETVQVFLGEKGLEAVSPFGKGNSSSGYSRNDEQLGGGFDFDYSPMMTVSTSHRSYWRGETKSVYTGEGWISTGEAEDDVRMQDILRKQELPLRYERPLAKTIEVNQIVTMVRKDVYPVLFAATPVNKVNWVGSEETTFPRSLEWLTSSWELHWSEMYGEAYPETYSITSQVTVLDEDGLRKTHAGWSNTNNPMYLMLPDTVPQRVRDLAQEVTATATNDYDKAKLLVEYLRLNFNYNNKPDLSKATGKSNDFVDTFLFEIKEGYCDYFSSAMAVLSRSLDLPTRWVKGFSPGSLPASAFGGPPEEMMGEDVNPNGSGTYTVRNSDAHSWVEIYFEGYGWIPFEATAGFSFPYTLPEEEVEALPDVNINDSGNETVTNADNNGIHPAWLWSSISLIVVAAAVWMIVRRDRLMGAWRKVRHGAFTSNDRIVLETHKLLRICKKRGMEREEHETMREAVLRWSQSQKRLRDDFRFVLDGFEQAKYSTTLASNDEVERFVNKVKSLIDQLK
jgi:transglutaminase-like putative cysteine protease